MLLLGFLKQCTLNTLRGSRTYWSWLLLLFVLMAVGLWSYIQQLDQGLILTGMSDQVSWGFYISNFTFLVGIASSAVLLVVPAYIFHRQEMKDVVLIGEGLAVAAVTIAILFVVVDLGRPDRVLHMLPVIGKLNFPASLLAWDVLVLSGYLVLNLLIPVYVLFGEYRARDSSSRIFALLVITSMFWAISIHTVTAFLFSANPARPMWHTALLGPRFIASAFASGPALMILIMHLIKRVSAYPISQSVIDSLAIIMTIAMQITVFFIGVELFTDFYNEGTHSASMQYLYFGLDGFSALQPWILLSLAMNLVAVVILMVNPLRRNMSVLNATCVLVFIGIWIEKGLGLVIPGFIPTPLGEVFEYSPTQTELMISAGIWALGCFVFTVLAKPAIAIRLGELSAPVPGRGRIPHSRRTGTASRQ